MKGMSQGKCHEIKAATITTNSAGELSQSRKLISEKRKISEGKVGRVAPRAPQLWFYLLT